MKGISHFLKFSVIDALLMLLRNWVTTLDWGWIFRPFYFHILCGMTGIGSFRIRKMTVLIEQEGLVVLLDFCFLCVGELLSCYSGSWSFRKVVFGWSGAFRAFRTCYQLWILVIDVVRLFFKFMWTGYSLRGVLRTEQPVA